MDEISELLLDIAAMSREIGRYSTTIPEPKKLKNVHSKLRDLKSNHASTKKRTANEKPPLSGKIELNKRSELLLDIDEMCREIAQYSTTNLDLKKLKNLHFRLRFLISKHASNKRKPSKKKEANSKKTTAKKVAKQSNSRTEKEDYGSKYQPYISYVLDFIETKPTGSKFLSNEIYKYVRRRKGIQDKPIGRNDPIRGVLQSPLEACVEAGVISYDDDDKVYEVK